MQVIFSGTIIKPKGFCPDPVVKYGVPDFADSVKNPKVWGTVAWQQWWEDQIDKCINGYETAGIQLTGPNYKFLNFGTVSTVGKGNHPPGWVDFQYDLFNTIKYAKQTFHGVIGLKARRRGLSEVVSDIIDGGFRFKTGYHAGICAGLQEHTDDFVAKFKRSLYLKRPELMVRTLVENADEIIAGWQEKDSNGQWVDKGSRNTIYMATMLKNPNVFKGKYLDDAVFEEGGEFPLLDLGFNATEACFKDGDFLVGTPYVYGTGGNMSSGSKAFAAMWHEAKALRLIKFFVPSSKMYFPCVSGYKDAHGVLKEDVPYLKELYTESERIGMDDEKRAAEIINERALELKRKKDTKAYWDFMQNYCLTEKQAFMKFSGNNFDAIILNEGMYNLQALDPQYQIYEMSWVLDEKGKIKEPREVKAEPVSDTFIDPFDSRHLIMIYKMPRKGYKNLDVGGIDGYNQDESKVSKSLGAMVVYRRNHDFSFERNVPVALINYRPRVKEIFFETCMMASVFYELIGNTLADAGSDLVIQHYQNNGCSRYLALRPTEFDSEGGEQVHKYGVKFTVSSKPKAIGILQTEIVLHSHKWVFPQLYEECLDYDVNQKKSDWDTADALMVAKMRDIDMLHTHRVIDESKVPDKDPFAIPYWEEVNGVMVNRNAATSKETLKDPFLRMIRDGQV
jgi:hypothetical protein